MRTIAPKDLASELQSGGNGLLLDVRTPGEFNDGHAPAARLMPLGDLEPKQVLKNAGPNCQRIFVVCQSGARAKRAIAAFEKAGFAECVLVEGGMDAWARAGLPIERNAAAGLPIMRQVQIIVGATVAVASILALTLDPRFALISLLMGGGLLIAGATGFCGLAMVLAKMPWNRLPACANTNCCAN